MVMAVLLSLLILTGCARGGSFLPTTASEPEKRSPESNDAVLDAEDTDATAADVQDDVAGDQDVDVADFPVPPPTARIVFSAAGYSVSRSREEIFVMNIDGTGITNISNSPEDDRHPAWSPNKTKIIFLPGHRPKQ